MNILIFGASGATGRQLVSQALDHRHTVSAFVRDRSKLPFRGDGIKIFEGDVAQFDRVEEAVGDQDAVFSALGASSPFKRDAALIHGVRNIVSAMTKRNVSRFIYQSFLGVKENRNELGLLIDKILPIVLRSVILDHEEKERIIINSDLRWTIVRCAMLTNGPFTGRYRAGEHVASTAFLLPSVSRADVAAFMLRQVSEDTFLRKKPRIFKSAE